MASRTTRRPNEFRVVELILGAVTEAGLTGREAALHYRLVGDSLLAYVGQQAAYLLFTGSTWEGVVLVACGILVIGMIDNVLRPILVGSDTRMPDFVILIATLAGLELFGLNGFIIGPVIAALFIAVWKIAADERLPTAIPVGDTTAPSP